MSRNSAGAFITFALCIACLAAIPSQSYAQYNCAVTIELNGKVVLRGAIRDVERPPTEILWEEKLKTLPFSPTADGKNLPAKLDGKIRVIINGAGQVDLKELHLVAGVIASEDFKRIVKLRKASGYDQPKK